MNVAEVSRNRIVSILLLAASGCAPASPPASNTTSAAPYISAVELNRLLGSRQRLVLVEFSVEHGCFRCDELRPQFEQLAQENDGKWVARRVNLNYERSLVAELGITVCPSYVAFVDGREAFRSAYPASKDLLQSQLAAAELQP